MQPVKSGLLKQLGWFVLLWLISVASLGLIAWLIRWAIKR